MATTSTVYAHLLVEEQTSAVASIGRQPAAAPLELEAAEDAVLVEG